MVQMGEMMTKRMTAKEFLEMSGSSSVLALRKDRECAGDQAASMTEKMPVSEYRALSTLARPKHPAKSTVHPLTSFLDDLRLLHLPEPELEFPFHHKRKWRFDVAWPAKNVACGLCVCGHLTSAHRGPTAVCLNCACAGYRIAWQPKPLLIALEYNGIHGGSNVGHASIRALQRDYEKLNEAQLLGWLVLQITAESIRTGAAHEWVRKAFELKEGTENQRQQRRSRIT